MKAPALEACGYVRLVLRSIVLCFSIILISSMAMVKFSQAEGLVPFQYTLSLTTLFSGQPGFDILAPVTVSATVPYRLCDLCNYDAYVTAKLALWNSAPATVIAAPYTHTKKPFVVAPAIRFESFVIGYLSNGGYFGGDIDRGIGYPYSLNESYLCPANSSGASFCTCNTGYQPDSTKTSCVVACPAHASGTPCACDAGYKFDAAGTSCEPVVTCSIDPLPKPPPPFSDACSNSLEKGAGTDVDNACATGLTPDMVKGASCLADKIRALAIPYTKPSATIRTTAYQEHLLAVWNKSIEIENKYDSLSDAEKQECAARIANVTNEKAHHGIDSDPSAKGDQAPHVLGRAIDIPRAVVKALIAKVPATTVSMLPGCFSCTITITGNVEDYVNSATVNPPACNLRWGGRFSPVDPVHFQLP